MRSASRRGLGPYDRRAPALQRQDRKRPGRQEMLLGAAFVVALVVDVDDDGGLAVVPAMHGDAGAFADARTRAVGGDERAAPSTPCRRRVRTIGSIAVRRRLCATADARQIDAAALSPSRQRVDQIAVLDHVGERLARFDFAGEGQKYRPHRIVEPAVGHHHVEDRLGLAGDAVPDADGASNSRRAAATIAEARSSLAWLAPSVGSATVTAKTAQAPHAARWRASARQSRRRAISTSTWSYSTSTVTLYTADTTPLPGQAYAKISIADAERANSARPVRRRTDLERSIDVDMVPPSKTFSTFSISSRSN